jgi:phenylalanyl-tRNA synthetase alpha chain
MWFDEAALDHAFAQLERQAREAAAALDGEAAVEAFKLQWLGRKQGRLNEVSGRWLKAAPAEAKKLLGVRFNALKALVEQLLDGGCSARGRGRGAQGRGHRHHAAGHAAADRAPSIRLPAR